MQLANSLVHLFSNHRKNILQNLITIFCYFILSVSSVEAQTEIDYDYEDITVYLVIQNVGGYEIDAVYMNDQIYVDVATLFNLLKINNIPSRGNDSITGFFLNEENRYSINAETKSAQINGNYHKLDRQDIFRSEMGLYLRNTEYGKLFGLNLQFNFRSLTIELKTDHELPVIKEMRQNQMRKNIDRLSGVVEVDTTISIEYHLFRGGMVDWSVISTQNSNERSDTRATIAGTAELLGGEAIGMVNYSTITGFEERQQQYKWRWVNNDAKVIKQVQAGKIPIKSTSSLYAPVIGVSLTNTPASFRKSFGSFVLSDYTEPGWTVELYINNVIVDFTTADASGFFSFEVPLVYGASQLTLKYFGPWGEERIKEQTINIPYNFLPSGTLEYNITGGMVKDSTNGIFSRAESMYGIHRNITIGAGIEYLSLLDKNQAMPFFNASARFLNNFLFTGEYTHNVKTRGLLNYRLPSGLSFEIDYTNYVPRQKAISYNYLEERKASLSIPIRMGAIRSFARIAYRQNVLPQTTYSSAEVMISSFVKGVSTNISAFANWLPDGNPYIYSNIALGFRIGRSVNFRPQSQIDITNGRFISYKAELEKSFSQISHVAVVFEDNLKSGTKSIELSFRYDLPFAQTLSSARIIGSQGSHKDFSTVESARGSFAFDSGNAFMHTDNRSATGRGALTIIPFLDLNNNNIKEENEPVAIGLNLRLNGGRIIKNEADSLIRIIELEPYTSYLLELDDNSFENIAWQLINKSISIIVDPGQFKHIGIPIKVMGEANGMVYLRKGNTKAGIGRIVINFTDQAGRIFNRVMSESDGYYNFLGLPPGNYKAMPDTSQLERLGLISEPEFFEFTITPDPYGDIIDEITFILTPKQPEAEQPDPTSVKDADTGQSTGNNTIKEDIKSPIRDSDKQKDNSDTPPQGNYNRSLGQWFVQAGAFVNIAIAKNMQNLIFNKTRLSAGVILDSSLYKVRLGNYPNKTEAFKISTILKNNDIPTFIGK